MILFFMLISSAHMELMTHIKRSIQSFSIIFLFKPKKPIHGPSHICKFQGVLGGLVPQCDPRQIQSAIQHKTGYVALLKQALHIAQVFNSVV